MNTNQTYKVTATSHIACVAYTITTEIPADKVEELLADGVLYNAQRAAASKAVKALGGGKRADIVYNAEARDAVQTALEEVFGDAEISTREHVKGAKAEIKFAQARKILSNNKGKESKVAAKVDYEGELFLGGDFHPEFLLAVHEWVNNPFANE
jgi:adenylyl- and sulfurtransferase ThiI